MNRLPEMPIRAKYATLDSEGNNIAEALAGAGGTKLYQHKITLSGAFPPYAFFIYSTSSTPVTLQFVTNNYYLDSDADIVSAISGSASNNLTPLLVLGRTLVTGHRLYSLYSFDSNTGTFTTFDLSSATISDTVTSL